jgi:hypothetical protein
MAGTLLALGGVLGLRAVSGGGDAPPAHAAPAPAAVDGQAARTVHISMNDGELTPRRLFLEAGRPVRIVVHNIGHWFHDLYVEGLGIHLHLWPEDVIETQVTPARGKFHGGCIAEGHEQEERITIVAR